MARVQIIQASPNVVKIGQEASTVSIMEQKTSVSIQASIIVTEVVEGTGDSTPHALVDAIEVTNNDTALGDAVGKYYGAETTFEEIFSDILHPVEDSEITSLNLLTLAGGTFASLSGTQTYEFGRPIEVIGYSAALQDDGNEFNDSDALALDVDPGNDVLYTVSGFYVPGGGPATGWEQLGLIAANLQSTPAFPQFTIQNTTSRTATYRYKLKLQATNSSGASYLVESNQVTLNFYQKRWAFASEQAFDVEENDSLNDILLDDSTTITDDALQSSSVWNNAELTGMPLNEYFYFALPSTLVVNLEDPSSISTGSSDVAQAFFLIGLVTYDTSFTDEDSLPVTFSLNLYRTINPGAFTDATTLTITPN